MSKKKEYIDLFESSHLTILVSYTVFASILVAESLLLGWEKWALLLIVTGILLCILAIILHCTVIWDWKDDVVYAWMVSVMIAFSDEIRAMLQVNLAGVMLAVLAVYIAVKFVILIMKEW